MRSGVCALQQTLTAEAASVLKHSLGLARRRGHAQVTPLHVAATLLSLRGSSLRRACLKSQPHQNSHPLQCRALELCFNVALNRLPTTPAPLPSLSNALIAALKRAQAHQRRGSIDQQQQQQPLLTIKVDLQQLIISILDDPSVSRVMREAGFSSTSVKNNIEDSSHHSVFQCYNTSGGVFSSPSSPSATDNHSRETTTNPTNFRHTHHFLASYASEFHPSLLLSPPPVCSITGAASSSFKDDDIRLVLDILLRRKKKNIVIVGDSVSLTEGLVGELRGRLERSEVPDELKSTHFIKFQFSPVSLSCMKRDEVEMKLLELKRKVDSVASGGGGGIFYVGDLKWTVEEASFSEKEEGFTEEQVSGYNPVDHLVSEIGKLFCDCGTSNNAKVWLMATASYQTYMRCQMRQPPLEKQWALQAVPVPSGGLGLTLHAPSFLDSKMTISQNQSHVPETKPYGNMDQQDKLNCCEECTSNYEKEAQFLRPDQKKMLPFWLQSHSTEDHNKDELVQLKRKWNRLCHCLHQNKRPHNQWNWNHNSYNSPNSISFANNATHGSTSKLVPRFRRQQSCIIEFNFGNQREATEPVLDSLESMDGKEVKTTLALGNGGSGESAVGDITDTTLQRAHICKLLQDNVPWQSETVPSIAEALIDSKSAKQNKSITWLLVQGNDTIGKRRLALAIAESVFGSTDVLLHFDMLKRETSTVPFSQVLAGALRTHQQLVVLTENVDFADAQFKKFLSDVFETGKFGNSTEDNSCQVIFILTNGGCGSTSIEEQNEDLVMRLLWQVSEAKPNLETPSAAAEPCLGHKRRAELDLFSNIRSSQGSKKKEFSRQASFNNTLDLNMKADEEDKAGESSPVSSDLTRETVGDPLNQNEFLDSIVNRFEFNTNPGKDREMAEFFLCKIKGSFEEVYGKRCLENLSVDERVIEDVCVGCGYFTNSLFEKWLKCVFQSSLETVNFGGKEGILFRLSWGGKGHRKSDSGFMSSSLPNCIQVNYFIE